MIDTQQMIDDLNRVLEAHGFKVVCISSRLQSPVLEPEPASECGLERFAPIPEHPFGTDAGTGANPDKLLPVLEPEPASERGSEHFAPIPEHPRTPMGGGSKLARIRAIMNRGATP